MSAASPSSSRQRALVLICFFLSGAAGLIYQVTWAKSLALGSDWIGRWSERRKNPLCLYALLEVGIPAFGAVSPFNLAGVHALYIHAYPFGEPLWPFVAPSSEPSNFWMAGIADLYTSEYYREARARLAPGGLFVQWVQGYSLEPANLRMVFRTFSSEFPRVTLWRGEVADYLLLGQSSDAAPLSLDRFRLLWPQPNLYTYFRKLGLERPEGMLAYHLLDEADLRRFAQDASFNTDNLTLLEFPRSKEFVRRTQ